MRETWRVLAARRDLRFVLSAGLVSMSGDWILLVGLLYKVYALTGSTLASALTMLSAGVPQVLLAPVAGVLADRWDRKLTMVYADLLLAGGLLPLLAVRGSADIWIVFPVLFWESAVQQFFSPAQQAMVPRLVPDGQLFVANALNGQIGDVSRLVGSALGGVIAAVGGITAVTLADAASFVVSALLLLPVRTSGRVTREATAPTNRRLAGIAADLRAGLLLIAGQRSLRVLLVFGIVTSLGEGVFATLIAPFVEHTLHGTSGEFGLVAAAQAVGGIAGGLFAAAVGQRISAYRLLSLGAVAFGLADLAIFLYPLVYPALWPAVVGMVVTGLPGALTVAGMTTLLQRGVGDSYRGRLFGALGATQGIAVLVGTLAAGYLSRSLGIIPVLAVQGAVWTLAGLGLLVLRRYEERAGDPDRSALEMPHQVGDLGGRSDHPGGDRGDPLLRQPEGGA